MADLFVCKDGNDGNSGASYAAADAKLTIQAAIDASATGDVIHVGPGVYNESLLVSRSGGLSIEIYADGYVILDGENTLANGVEVQSPDHSGNYLTIYDFIVKSFTNFGFGVQFSPGHHANVIPKRCIAYDCTYGYMMGAGTDCGLVPTDCQAYDCQIGFYHAAAAGGRQMILGFCVAAFCTTGFQKDSTGYMDVRHCISAYNTHLAIVSNVSNLGFFDYNDMWFDGVADATWLGVTYTDLATWQAAVTPFEVHSISEDPVFCDPEKRIFQLHVTSGLFTKLREGGVGSSAGPVPGVLVGAISVSKNDLDGYWADKILSGTVVNGQDNVELDAGPTEGYVRTPVIDLGRNRKVRRINIKTNLNNMRYPTDVPDFDPADVEPKRMTYRYRISAVAFVDSDVSPFWVEIEPSAFGFDINTGARYIQVEVTLRNDGV